jgi:hypothetical protein
MEQEDDVNSISSHGFVFRIIPASQFVAVDRIILPGMDFSDSHHLKAAYWITVWNIYGI